MMSVTHKSCHQAGVANVALKSNAFCYSSSHDGGCCSTEGPVEEKHVPTAVSVGVVLGVAQSKVSVANKGVAGVVDGLAKGKTIPA